MAKQTILITKLPERHVPLDQGLAWSAKMRGISKWRIGLDIMRRNIGRQTLTPDDYFMFGLHHAKMSDAERDCFIGIKSIVALNLALSARKTNSLAHLLRDKVKMAMVLERANLPTTEIRAAFVTEGKIGPWPMLRSASEVAAYLLEPRHLPLFGKPVIGSRSVGVVAVVAADGPMVELSDGRRVAALELAQEIVTAFPDGYIFQELLCHHPEVEHLTGPTIGSLRVCSIWEDGAAKPLYAVLRLPGKGAMADDPGSGVNNVICTVDMQSGRLLRAQDGGKLGWSLVDATPATGQPLLGVQLPDVAQAVQVALTAHEMFPQHGIMGTDMILSNRGPLINELNRNPLHTLYQRASGVGFLNPDFRPRLAAILARNGITKRQRGLPLP